MHADDSPNSPAVSDDELVWYSTSKDKDGLRINIESVEIGPKGQ